MGAKSVGYPCDEMLRKKKGELGVKDDDDLFDGLRRLLSRGDAGGVSELMFFFRCLFETCEGRTKHVDH